MPITLELKKGFIDIEKDDIVIKTLIVDDLWPIIMQSKIDESKGWRTQIRPIFDAIMNRMVMVNGKHLTPSEIGRLDLPFILELGKVLSPYLRDTIWPVLCNSLNMESVSEISEN